MPDERPRASGYAERISPEEYQATLAGLGSIASLCAVLPLEQFIRAIDLAESVGPVLDPTLFQAYLSDPKARLDLRAAKELAEIALAFKRKVEALRREMGELRL